MILNQTITRLRTYASALAFSAVLAAPVLAQTAPAPEQPAQGAGTDAGSSVGDIVVTAQKRSERLQDVPIAVTAISGNNLTAAGAVQTADIPVIAPSVHISQGLGYIKPYIRGVGTSSNGPGIESPVSIYIDGVYISDGPSGLFGFNNIERIEILNGPQGTLFGRNATGGLINVITRDPTQKTEIELSGTGANYATVAGNLYVAGGLGQDVAAGIALQYKHQGDGWGKNLTTGNPTYSIPYDFSGRSKLVVNLGSTTIHISGDYTTHKVTTSTLGPAPGTRPTFGPAKVLFPTYDVTENADVQNRLQGGGGSVKIEHDFGNVSLMSLTSYRRSVYKFVLDFDLSPLPALTNTGPATQRDRQFSQELQLQTTGHGPLSATAGVFYFNARSDSFQILDFGTPLDKITGNDLITLNGDQITRTAAGYAQATYALTDTTHLTGGFRYTWEQRGINGTRTLTTLSGVNVKLPFADGARSTYKTPTWRLSLDQKIGPDAMVYASYNRGFKSGGYNLSSPGDPAYLPEKIDAYEVGFKSLLDNRLIELNGSAFYYKYKNIQVARFQNGAQSTYNGAAARIYGVDLDSEANIGPNFKLRAAASYLNGRFTSFPSAYTVPILPSGLPGPQSNVDATGNLIPNAPKFTASLGMDVNFPLKSGGSISGSANYQYNDGFFTEPDNQLKQPAYSIVNLSVRWRSTDEHFGVELWGRNLLNSFISTQLQSSSTGYAANFQAPLTFGGTVSFKY